MQMESYAVVNNERIVTDIEDAMQEQTMIGVDTGMVGERAAALQVIKNAGLTVAITKDEDCDLFYEPTDHIVFIDENIKIEKIRQFIKSYIAAD